MMPRFPDISGFVLAGGESRRMGRDKALLPIAGQTMLERTAALLEPLVSGVTVLGSPDKYGNLGWQVLPDAVPNRGPLAALVTGLRSTTTDWNLFLTCDLPFMEASFLEFLLASAREALEDAIVPRTADGPQPLCALYRRSALAVMERMLASGEVGVVDCFDALPARFLTEEVLKAFAFPERLFKNMNAPEDYERARQFLEGHSNQRANEPA